MKNNIRIMFYAYIVLFVALLNLSYADPPSLSLRTMDVVYARRDGTALTLDVFEPKVRNGAAVVHVICGGYFSSHADIHGDFYESLLTRGYIVFAVIPGSRPSFQVPEMRANVSRAVRFIRFNENRFRIDPHRIGIMGSSAGGNLALLAATGGDDGDLQSNDPVERGSSRVQAAAVFFPLTDFLNWSRPGEEHIGVEGHPIPFRAAFDYREMNEKTGLMERITEPGRLHDITKSISPIYQLSADDPPLLLMHGDKDFFVPLYQSESFVKAGKDVGAKVEMIIKPGGQHGWPQMEKDVEKFADWFDQHFPKK